MDADNRYRLPDELARHAPKEPFAPDELRGACRVAGEGLGREDVRSARFRSASEMVSLWGVLDLPARVAPYALRHARLGYVQGYASALVSGELPEDETARAADARWGGGWQGKLHAARLKTEAGPPTNDDWGRDTIGGRASTQSQIRGQALHHVRVILAWQNKVLLTQHFDEVAESDTAAPTCRPTLAMKTTSGAFQEPVAPPACDPLDASFDIPADG